MNRDQMLSRLAEKSTVWDVIIIGGGATGLGAALDSVTRGYRTVLLDASDFAKGTSSRSTKLIHGGVRYLRQGQISMVRHSLQERSRLLSNASHLVHPLSFVLPAFRTGSRWFYYAGLKAYDLLSSGDGFPAARMLSHRQTLDQLPTLRSQQLRGGVAYSDGQFDDARLAISLALSIADHGGTVVNYAPVTAVTHDRGRADGVEFVDAETGNLQRLRGRVVINATGAFSDAIMNLDRHSATGRMNDQKTESRSRIRLSQGSHVVLNADFLGGSSAMMIPETDDGRVLFAIPWHGRTLLGTTDVAVDRVSEEPRPTQNEVDYLLDHAGRYFRTAPRTSEIRSMYAGLRPLVASNQSSAATSGLSREHEILTSDSGLISVIGGKWTTYRRMGQDVVDLAQKVGRLVPSPSRTAGMPLHGAIVREESNMPYGSLQMQRSSSASVYGSDAVAVQKLAATSPDLGRRVHPEFSHSMAEVVWAVRHEMARNVEDVLSRRIRLLLLDAAAAVTAAEDVADLLMRELGKSIDWKQSQLASFRQLATGYLPVKG